MIDHDLELDTRTRCPDCDGNQVVTCPDCDLGWIKITNVVIRICDHCGGLGYVTCPRCAGSGEEEAT